MRRQFVAFARRIGARKIHAQLIAQHEAHNRQRHVALGAHADAHHECASWAPAWAAAALLVEHRDAHDFGAAIAETVVDIGDGLHHLRRMRTARRRAVGIGRDFSRR
jgi:hypothetical protein